jgi:hypothetical protein
MNLKFMKALYLLDAGKYEKGEECLIQAMEECDSDTEIIMIKSCYAELLYMLERYDEAKVQVDFIIANADEYCDVYAPELESAKNLKKMLEGIK